MAPKVKAPKQEPEKVDTVEQAGDQEFWANLLGTLDKGTANSSMIFPKDGKTLVRLIRKPKSPFYIEVDSTYRQKTKVKYLMMAYQPITKDGEELKVKGLLVAKTVFKAIVALLSEGYDFFNPITGHGLTIIRSGTGLDTNYTVVPSAKEVPIPAEIKKQVMELTLEGLKKSYEEANKARQNGSGKEGGHVADDEAEEEWS